MSKMDKVKREIEKRKKALIKKAKSKGLWENFGQDQVRALKEKYADYCYGDDEERKAWDLISQFDEWCMYYTGLTN